MKGKIVGDHYYVEGQEVSEAEFWNKFPPVHESGSKGKGLVGWKKLKSVALSVHPDQVKEAIDDATAKGVPTHFDADGSPVFESRSHRKAYCKAYGFFDRDAGYSDQAFTGERKPEPVEYADVGPNILIPRR